jgi:hypothetical protein
VYPWEAYSTGKKKVAKCYVVWAEAALQLIVFGPGVKEA